MNSSTVITGLGAISSLGLNVSAFWHELKSGHSGIRPFDLAIKNVKTSVAATVSGFDPEKYFTANELPLLDKFSQFAVVAALEAVADAGLVIGEESIINAAAIIGSGCCGKHNDEEAFSRLFKEKRTRVHPLTIPRGMPSAAASLVSIHLGIKGPAFVVASACASGAHAIIQGMLMIQAGIVDVALVGGTDATFTYGLLKSWDALRVVSNDTCRPFCKDRSGIVLGEGAGVLVLESEEHATQRGARIYAEIAGCGMTSDAGHITRPDVTGITNAMKKAIHQAGVKPEEVDYVNAHGTATHANDIAETEAIHLVFGDHAKKLAVSSTKSMHGHALGASSALELVATTMAIHHGVIPPTANFTVADDKCDLDYVTNQARKQDIHVALSNSFAFGGLNTVIALKKYSEKTQ